MCGAPHHFASGCFDLFQLCPVFVFIIYRGCVVVRSLANLLAHSMQRTNCLSFVIIPGVISNIIFIIISDR